MPSKSSFHTELIKLSRIALVIGTITGTFTGCLGRQNSLPARSISENQVTVSSCDNPKSAQILVGDGFMAVICGCTGTGEANGTVFSSTAPLTCRLATSDTVVLFNFVGNIMPHQIMPVGEPARVVTPYVEPSDDEKKVYAVTFDQAGTTYSFQDLFDGVQGQIIVP